MAKNELLIATYLFSKSSQQYVVGRGREGSLGPLFDHLCGYPDQTCHLQDEKTKH